MAGSEKLNKEYYKDMFDYDNFVCNIRKKMESCDYLQNVDMLTVLCLRDMRNYKYYIDGNKTEAEKFAVCYEALAHILMNRAAVTEVRSSKYVDMLENFLELLYEEDEDNEYFDHCANITVEIIYLLEYISTKDIEKAVTAAEKAFECAEAHFQECDLPEEEYNLKIEEFAKQMADFDIRGLSSFLNLN